MSLKVEEMSRPAGWKKKTVAEQQEKTVINYLPEDTTNTRARRHAASYSPITANKSKADRIQYWAIYSCSEGPGAMTTAGETPRRDG